MNIRSQIKQILTQKENRRYEKLLSARQMTYEQWIRQKEAEDAGELALWQKKAGKTIPQNVSSTEAKILFRCFVSPEGALAENALLQIAQYFHEHPETQIVYGDEDALEHGVRKSPWFKPDWSPDLLESCFYFGSVVAAREKLVQRLEKAHDPHYSGSGLQTLCTRTEKLVTLTADTLAVVYEIEDMAAYEKWVYRAVSWGGGWTTGYIDRNEAVGHIAKILFHCKSEEGQKKYLETSDFLQDMQKVPLRDFRDTWMTSCAEQSEEDFYKKETILSVVIPSKDHPEMLEQCIRGCCKGIEGIKTEIIIVDNGSNRDNKCYIEELIRELKQELKIKIIYLYQPMDFHFSMMCNMGAKRASGWFLLFLNDDVELVDSSTILRMGALANRDWTGAVGIKLYYPESNRIQHAGITNLPMGPVHKLQFLSDTESCYFDANRGLRNVMAVTAACLMVDKAKFDSIGGFSEELPVAFNDVDLCFSLYELGYHNVCINDIYAYHHESLSRGDDESVEKRERLMAERDKLYARHSELEGVDSYYSEDLNREGLDTRIRPAYETAGNRIQQVIGKLSTISLQGYREDACVLLRVESLRDGNLQGYSVVLGDNNACYDKRIILIKEQVLQEENTASGEQNKTNVIYGIATEGQYRSDLVENMSDQMNVGLSGFWVKISKETLARIPKGRYRVGMTVRNRVTGLKLFNKSNCYLINTAD